MEPQQNASKNLSIAKKFAILETIKDHPPFISNCHLLEITGVRKYTIACLINQQDKLQEEWELNGKQGASQKCKM